MNQNISKELLEEYIDDGLSSKKIAEKCECSQTNIMFYLKKFQLKTKCHGPGRKSKVRKTSCCKHCGGSFVGRGKKFCSQKCMGEFRIHQNFQLIESGETNFGDRVYKRYLINKFGDKCMKCGWGEKNPTTDKVPTELNHIDGNPENNLLSNLEIVCPNCHSLTPNYRALNTGNGRKNRRKR